MTTRKVIPTPRLIPLEGCRGLAATIVLIHHFFLAFSPITTGYLAGFKSESSLVGQPYFVLFNGLGAVGFFFTLSGFVLCWSYFHHENSQKLTFAIVKRLPRLVGLVVLTTIGSYLLFKFEMYYFIDASKISLSPWLASFAGSKLNPDFEISVIKAIFQGLTTFLVGGVSYNTVLWTMNLEFFGSMIVYMLSFFIAKNLKFNYFAYIFAIIAISSLKINPLILPFVTGTFLSAYLAKKKTQFSFLTSIFFLFFGLYLLGYVAPEKAYSWVFFKEQYAEHIQSIIHTFGSMCIILAVMTNQKIFNSLNAPFFKWLGKISFPLYLVHCLVIFSSSSYLYLIFSQYKYNNQLILIMVLFATVVISALLSIPLSKFDDWYVNKVNVFFSNYFK